MKELFLLSGLGADKRVFEFLDLTGYNLHYIEWIPPLKDESIEGYASRLINQINVSDPVLIGVSFGGMMAVEIGKQIKTHKIILISSAKTKKDLPFRNDGLLGKSGLHKLLPPGLPKRLIFIMYWLFGTKLKSEKKLLKEIIQDTDNNFSVWAMDKIVGWKNERLLTNIVHIHGTADRVLRFSNADYSIEGGGHFMVVNQAGEISKIIRKELEV